MSKDEITYVVCVYWHQDHLADSLAVKCSKCGAGVWISPHHTKEKNRLPLCWRCMKEIKDPEWKIDQRDIKRAVKEIKRIKEGR